MIDPALAAQLDAALEADLEPILGRLGKVKRYLDGDHDLPYMPNGAQKEYKALAERSITNWTPLLSDTFASIAVDGYRPAKASDNSEAWGYWQANKLDARQAIAHRGALEYGASYTLVLPGTLQTRRVPVIRPLSPLRSLAWYQDEDDEYPEVALQRKGTTTDGTRLIDVFDKDGVYTFALPKDDEKWILSSSAEHGLGVTPFVRFRERIDGEARGVIRPMFNIQDRINEVVFSTQIALQYASFRQRWATGMAIPMEPILDEDGKPTGEERAVEPFKSAVDRLWVAEDETVRFGDFAQTEMSGHGQAYDSAIRDFVSISQTAGSILTGDLINLSGDALAEVRAATDRRSEQHQLLFGEAWESTLRLGATAAGNPGAADEAAQVRWRVGDNSLAATVDALGKLATMLTVPVEGLWERIPGVTSTDIEYWKSLREADPLAELTAEIARQGRDTDSEPSPAAEQGADPAEMKAKADAMGVLIRSGVTSESAAAQVGLNGLEFSGGVPVSLRFGEED